MAQEPAGQQHGMSAELMAVKDLELQLQTLGREDARGYREMKELAMHTSSVNEQIDALRDRLGDVTAEQSHLTIELAKLGHEAANFDLEGDSQMHKLVSYRESASAINTAFQNTLKRKLNDESFINKLSERNHSRSKIEYCRVLWEDESAEWKVHDPRDGSELTFAALLEDCSRYWGVVAEEFSLEDENDRLWPLDHFVRDELATARETGEEITVRLQRRVGAVDLKEFDVEYEEDESLLPVAVRRARERERRAMLLARHTLASIRKEKERKRHELFVELRGYIAFMMLYTVVLLWRRSVLDAHYLLDALDNIFVGEAFGDYNEKEYTDIRNFEEFFGWANGPFAEGLLPGELYDGTEIAKEDKRVMTYNRVVGGVRLRQLRVTPGAGCNVAENVKDSFNPTIGPDAGTTRRRQYVETCYSLYRETTQSREPYSIMEQYWNNSQRVVDGLEPIAEGDLNGTTALQRAFVWRDAGANDLGNAPIVRGLFGRYDGSGFVFDLTNLTTAYIEESLAFLDENSWLDRQTRGLSIRLVVYNFNFNLYANVEFLIELSPAGVMQPSYTMQTMQMDLYNNWDNQYLFPVILEILLYLRLTYAWFNEFREVYATYQADGSIVPYFQDAWNVLDWSLIILSFVALALRVAFIRDPVVQNFDPFSAEYVEVTAPAVLYNRSFILDALAAFLGIFKVRHRTPSRVVKRRGTLLPLRTCLRPQAACSYHRAMPAHEDLPHLPVA